MKKIIIAIDGFSSCGKSTMAKALARNIGYLYFDSGAMYRAVALYCMQNSLIIEDEIDTESLKRKIKDINITFEVDPESKNSITYLNGINVEHEIRSLEVSRYVSRIAALDFVREEMVDRQREMGKAKGIVMDGRDIGTTVFPNAEMKVFVTASAEVRAQRRYDELTARGDKADFNEILENVLQRDHIDQTREVSPLKKADDALLLDNSNLTREEQMDWLIDVFNKLTEEC
ncbi:MAG: (d)CMP kinase [Bacteroidaceae bacterium]|nr:(d)CMP kinase [Bacteroidaceae bacterium]MBQ5616814.1 (d)CMP kinase [Bacteroidaceae bacterium]